MKTHHPKLENSAPSSSRSDVYEQCGQKDVGIGTDSPGSKRRGSVLGLAGANYLTVLLGFLTGPITARVLGPSGRGELAAAAAYGGAVVLVLSWGLPHAVSYRVSTGESKPGELLRPVMRWAALGAIPAAGAGLAVGFLLTNFSGPGRVGVAVVVALSPLGVVALCLEAMHRGRGDLETLTRARIVSIGLPAIGVVTLWLAGALSIGSVLAVTTVGSISTLAFVAIRLGAAREGRVALRPLLEYGSRSVLAVGAVVVSGRLDQAIIAPVLGSRDLGLYAVAVSISSLPLGLAYAISNRSWSEVGRAPAGEDSDIGALYVRRTVAAVFFATTLLALVAPFAIPFLFGPEFQASVAPTLILLPATVAGGLVMAGETGLSALGYPGRASWAQAGGTVIGILALVVLIGPFGINGAALATTLDFFVTAAALGVCLRRVGARQLLPGRNEFVELCHFGIAAAVAGVRHVRLAVRCALAEAAKR